MAKKLAAHTFKNNFWSKLRVERGITIKELAILCGVGEKRMGMYFSGQFMPKDYIIKDLCDYFNVPFEQGQIEFQHAHREWKADHALRLVKSSKKNTPKNEVVYPNDVITTEIPQMFTDLLENRKDFVLKTVYNKVDYDTYKLIERAFEVEL